MKNTIKLTTRIAVAALVTGALCCATPTFAQQEEQQGGQNESTSSSTENGQSSGMENSGSKVSTDSHAHSSSDMGDAKKTSGTNAGPGSNMLSKSDQQFMMAAAKSGMQEVEWGKAAEKQGKSAEVKHLGMMMVTDHTQANTELLALAKRHGVKINTKMPMEQMKGGGNFDQQWVSENVKAHEEAIKMFKMESKNGSNSEVRGFATTTLPTLQKHLRELEKAQGKKTGAVNNGWYRRNT